jgi:O-antigen/teichoic acid export membrane protein
LLGPEGRGQFAGAQVWPSIFGMVALLGINNALSLRAAKNRSCKPAFERLALLWGLPLAGVAALVGWFALPRLIPLDNPDLLPLSRLCLIQVPLFVLTSNLMAIDQGTGDFRRFNTARNILTPVYLVLLLLLWCLKLRQVAWFLGALLAANAAVLLYRLAVVRWAVVSDVNPVSPSRLVRDGMPFWITGIVLVLRDNAERLLLMFLLGPVALGLYVVAFTASGVHLNVSKSLNLIVFARSAAQIHDLALADAARLFRLMALLNIALGVAMIAGLPLLIRIVYGPRFGASVLPAMLLVTSQGLLSQGAILDEALRAQAKPFIGLACVLLGMATFAGFGILLAGHYGLVGVASAAIAGQVAYCGAIVIATKRLVPGIQICPSASDVGQLWMIAMSLIRSAVSRVLPAEPA